LLQSSYSCGSRRNCGPAFSKSRTIKTRLLRRGKREGLELKRPGAKGERADSAGSLADKRRMFDNLSFSGHGAVAKNCEASAVDRGLGNRRIRPPVKEARRNAAI
jgi:hypothetical protein